jgi:Ala-tRNA(Pro) deacylase
MAIATWVRDELNQRQIPFEELHHPEAYTAQQVAQYEHISGHRVAKVVCLMADGRPIELILPASRKVNLHWVGQLLGAAQIRLATEDELRTWFADCEVGAIPALRHWGGVDVLMDGHLQTGGNILILGGTHRDAVRMSFDDWFDLVQPRVELLSEPTGHRPGSLWTEEH